MRKPHHKPLRDKILKRRSIARTKRPTRKHQSLTEVPFRVQKKAKTWAMLALERQFNLPIEDILLAGSCRHIERRFGIDHSTVSKWKQRLGLNHGAEDGGDEPSQVVHRPDADRP